jgi:predicted nuclease of restriction endonuclease-like (RecB) superfamily
MISSAAAKDAISDKARQKRVTVDDRDYYLDLLFYHRRLKCLVAIELKLGEFEADEADNTSSERR